MAQEIAAQLKANLGITATIDLQESGTFLTNANTGKLPFFMLGWGADFPDTSNFLGEFFSAGSAPRFGPLSPELLAATKAGAESAERR